jgi:two-component system nitrate/nitrite response regulator NarL
MNPDPLNPNQITVAVVEDNSDLRDGLAQLIGGTPGYRCVGAFESCDPLLKQLNALKPEVVLMDIGLPGMTGIEGVSRVKEKRPETEVLMLTVFEDEKKIFDSICAGASGYLLKKTDPVRILEAIQEVRHGGAPMTAKIARTVLGAFQRAPLQVPTGTQLSEREKEVLAGLVQGLSYKMIADECSISIDTVRSHIRHIYEKLQVNSKAQAISLALQNRLV